MTSLIWIFWIFFLQYSSNLVDPKDPPKDPISQSGGTERSTSGSCDDLAKTEILVTANESDLKVKVLTDKEKLWKYKDIVYEEVFEKYFNNLKAKSTTNDT